MVTVPDGHPGTRLHVADLVYTGPEPGHQVGLLPRVAGQTALMEEASTRRQQFTGRRGPASPALSEGDPDKQVYI